MSKPRTHVGLLLALTLAVGCGGSDDGQTQPGTSTDGGADAGSDAPEEAGTDTGIDAKVEAGADASTDAVQDAPDDAPWEATTDAGADAAEDAAPDAPAEAGMDAAADGSVDAPAEAGEDGGAGTPNYVFVSSTQLVPSAFGGLSGADAICQNLADTAGLPGTYLAWLSTENTNAKDRLLATGARGWVRPDGKPFADSLTDLTSGQVFYPPRIDEHGDDVGPSVGVVTGTSSTGVFWDAYGSCSGYTDSGGNVARGVADTGTVTWTVQAPTSCSSAARLYCFGVDHDVEVSPSLPTGRLAFVSNAAFISGGGVTAADAICATEKSAAGLSGSYLALLATSAASAASRFDASGGPWSRVDGVQVAVTAQTLLADGELIAPIQVTAGGTYVGSSAVWTGFDDITAIGDLTCANWQGNAAANTGRCGSSNRSSSLWHNSGPIPCDASYARVYCLQE